MKIRFLFLFLFAFAGILSAQDTIFVRNGKPIPAIIIERNNTEIKYKKFGQAEPAAIYSVFVSDVSSIHFSDGIVADYTQAVENPAESKPKTAYEMAGTMNAIKFSTGFTYEYFKRNPNDDLLTFWRYWTGNPNAEIGGNPNYFPVLIKMGLILGKSGRHWLGDELQLIISPADAIYATENNGASEIKLKNFYYNIAMFYGYALNHKKNLLAIVEPGVDFTFMSGYIKIHYTEANHQKYNISSNFGVGFHSALGFNWIISKRLMIDTRFGYRWLSVKEFHEKEDGSSSGYFYVVPGADETHLKVKWNGPYANIGLFWSFYTKLKKTGTDKPKN